MSATYNWAYKPGVSNKYGFTVASSADDVRPSNCCYVALFGNDVTGNGSRQKPYRTIQPSQNNILASGVYRLTGNISPSWLVGDGDVVIDNSYNSSAQITTDNAQISNIYFKGSGASLTALGGNGRIFDCVFDGCAFNANTASIVTGCVFKNITGSVIVGGRSTNKIENNTYYSCSNIIFATDGNNLYPNEIRSCIFMNCNINISNQYFATVYSLFYQCNFSFTSAAGGVLYPGVPSGYAYYNTINSLTAAYLAAFPAANNILTGCTMADPLFNNSSIGDFSLAFNSPAKNLTYFGTYAGARSFGQSIKASATESVGGFDFSTAANLTINDDSLTITDTTQNSQIDTKLTVNPTGRELSKLSVLGITADRNGQYLSSITDLATTTKSTLDILSVPTPYLVENGAITYNGSTYQPGDRLTTVTGQTAFTTSSGGTLREILQAPERHTIMARFGDGSGTIAAGTALTAGYWYYVESGSVTYNSVAYNAGSSFKAVNTGAFTGTGVVTLALSTESFQHYEPGVQPTSNNTGDTRTGSIIRGNGDPNYVRGGLYVNEFPINARFFQIRFILQVNNLKS